MFLRFIAPLPDARRPSGVIHVGYLLWGEFAGYEQEWFDAAVGWFNRHLRVPDVFARSSRPGAHDNAVCWFKGEAHEFIGKMREITALLDSHGVPTEMIRTRQPGYVLYEDPFQVAAVPFRSTRDRR